MKKVLLFLYKRQLRVQGILLWALALAHFMGDTFWLFAIPAVIACGMQDILDEIRKIRKNGKAPEIF